MQLLESTKEPNEVGAAIHICYNADSVLKHLGVDVGESGGVRMERVRNSHLLGMKQADAMADPIVESFWRDAQR